MDHSSETIMRDWKIIATYIIVGFCLVVFVLTNPRLAFYVALCLWVLGAVVLLLSR
ncbi:hypothetical protein HAPAU_25490 [Halalkalicoccus paucihalophilus]|uniref:Uncharacterized protein n=1 Tax=Halalkalicoccus paucihalophilus TaxID=1008153 RepID=A0A151ADY8_9EURY|nr:hypothetical protein HAPAU_25490 [Halalkalicoccus paucihalophilus]